LTQQSPPKCLAHFKKTQKSLQTILKEVNAHFPECEIWKDSEHDPLARRYYNCGEATGLIRNILAQFNFNAFDITAILEKLKFEFLTSSQIIIPVLPIQPPIQEKSIGKKEPPPGTVS